MPKGVYIRTKRQTLEDKSPYWKGDDVVYFGLHQWLYRNFGKANKCENDESHTSKVFEWANLSGEYKRDRSDWKMLCQSCHRRKDAGEYCKRGHPLSGDNIRPNRKHRVCRACAKMHDLKTREESRDGRRLRERIKYWKLKGIDSRGNARK